MATLLSTFVAAACLELSILLDRSAFAIASRLHREIAPSLVLLPFDRLVFFAVMLLWVIPPALAIAFALHARWCSGWQWGFCISIACLICLFLARREANGTNGTRWAAGVAIVICIIERVASTRNFVRTRTAIAIQLGAVLVLFLPLGLQAAFAPRFPPAPKKVWSVVLQSGTWQAMSTGSEFAATRQVVFAGDRIVVAFDAGIAPYQDKQPMSRYRVLSLDKATGTVKNQMEFVGRWGYLPYVFATSDENVVLGNGALKVLKPDLVPTGLAFSPDRGSIDSISPDGTTFAWETAPGTTLIDANSFNRLMNLDVSVPSSITRGVALSGNVSYPTDYPNDHTFYTRTDVNGTKLIFHDNCGGAPQFLSSDRILSVGCGQIRILDNNGLITAAKQNSEGAYRFAGVDRAGTRFALEAYDERGDPSTLIYERLFIYDVNSAALLASVPVEEMPGRQSWSAFSADGRFFAVGNPNRLTMYELP